MFIKYFTFLPVKFKIQTQFTKLSNSLAAPVGNQKSYQKILLQFINESNPKDRLSKYNIAFGADPLLIYKSCESIYFEQSYETINI